MTKPTEEQIAWFQELWREFGQPVPDEDMAQSWFEEFPDTTKEEMRNGLVKLSWRSGVLRQTPLG
jgi:hypothetical protein